MARARGNNQADQSAVNNKMNVRHTHTRRQVSAPLFGSPGADSADTQQLSWSLLLLLDQIKRPEVISWRHLLAIRSRAR